MRSKPRSPEQCCRRAAAAILLLAFAVSSRALWAQSAPDSAAPTMNAVRFHSFGRPQVLQFEKIPVPRPGPGELLVRVIAAGVNPIDAEIRSGRVKPAGLTLPMTPGSAVSGIVELTGPGVERIRKGDSVFAMTALSRGGGYAEFALVKQEHAAPKPRRISHLEAAATPVAGLMAWQALGTKPEAGQILWIQGNGAASNFLSKIAKRFGMRVVNANNTRQAETQFRAQKSPPTVDLAFYSGAAPVPASLYSRVKKGGRLVSVGVPLDPAALAENGVKGELLKVQPNGEQLAKIGALIAAREVRPVVAASFLLKEARTVHRLLESSTPHGTMVLRVETGTPGPVR